MYNYKNKKEVSEKQMQEDDTCKRMIPARASFSPVSMSEILGTNTPGVSRTYMLG